MTERENVFSDAFLQAFEPMILNEGGYKLSNLKGDSGGMTYAGIARNKWPDWGAWSIIDAGGKPEPDLVRAFYLARFWVPLCLDSVRSQRIVRTIFDFSVNAGTATAAKLAQLVVGATPDGIIGVKTTDALNAYDADLFIAQYALAKIARYRDICTRKRDQQRFLLGWINRTLREAAL